jgi:hypothetical protein
MKQRMKESYRKGVANHPDIEFCMVCREARIADRHFPDAWLLPSISVLETPRDIDSKPLPPVLTPGIDPMEQIIFSAKLWVRCEVYVESKWL